MSAKAFAKIEAGLRDAIEGNISRVTIDGQTWVRQENAAHLVLSGGTIRVMGWHTPDPDDGEPDRPRYFGAMVEFAGPPEGNPVKAIWESWPVSIVIHKPEPKP